jgi:Na+-translocating ferredoxin:NAD+ oxidoreductase subunit E
MFFKNNTVFSLLLGLCPTLAVSTTLENAIGMGLATTLVLTFSNYLISLFRKIIPQEIRIPVFIVIIVAFVTTVDLLMAAYTPDLHKSLGIFIPLIVVNCIVLARGESFAYVNPALRSLWDGLISGLSFSFALILISSIRELLGSGKLLGHQLIAGYQPILMIIMPAGGFLVMGLILAAIKAAYKD